MFQPPNPRTAEDRILELEAQVKELQTQLKKQSDRLDTQMRIIQGLDSRTLGSIVYGSSGRY